MSLEFSELLSPSGRFLLRPMALSDQADLYKLDSDARVMEYFPSVRNRLESFEYLMENLGYANENPGLGKFVIESKGVGDFAGLMTLQLLADSGEIEVGYRLHYRYWGKGIATESTRMLLKHGFETIGLPRIVGICVPENLASAHILEKVGMDYSGMGEYFDLVVKCFVIEKNKWEKLFG